MKHGQRDSYIDIVKFVFSIIILLFHFSHNILPGGRMAVEGFFMFSGYLMMKSLERAHFDHSEIGIATIKFVAHKFLILFYYLFPSILLSNIVYAVLKHKNLSTMIHEFPLLLFEIFPMHSLGYKGRYIIGISWYTSSMLFSIAVLYPLCRKYGKNFILTIGIPLVLFIYGFLSHLYGNMKIDTWDPETNIIPTGLLRGFAGCMAGCILYYFSQKLSRKKCSALGKSIVILFQLFGWFYFLLCIKKYPSSRFDYVLVFLIFCLLSIGISGISGLKERYSHNKTKILGTISTLIVLNHFCWVDFLELYGYKNIFFTDNICIMLLIYLTAVTLSCIIVYYSGSVLQKYLKKLIDNCFISQ